MTSSCVELKTGEHVVNRETGGGSVMERSWIVLLTLAVLSEGRFHSRVSFNSETRGYEDIVVVVDDRLPRRDCKQVIRNIQVRRVFSHLI